MVRCERTGSLALRAIETAGFDLAIIDVNMPEISGYELAKRAANRNIPALLSSGQRSAAATIQRQIGACISRVIKFDWAIESGGCDRSALRYPSDLTDEEWAVIELAIPPAKQGVDAPPEASRATMV
jgi:CheY-like chemotaxis protein